MKICNAMQADDTITAVLVVGNAADWVDECRFMLQSFGLPSIAAHSSADAFAKIADPTISTLIIDQDLPGRDALDLAEQLALQAANEGRELCFILATEHSTVNVAVAAMRASVIDILPKPITREDLRNALLRVRGVKPEGMARKSLATQLNSLSLEIQRLTSLMDAPVAPRRPATAQSETAEPVVSSEFIRDLIRKEVSRRSLFDGRLFGDPAWEMLLDLLAAKLDGVDVSVSSACIASGAPTTTALRLINRLVGEKVLERIPDEKDRRRDFLRLSPEIEGPLFAYLSELARS